MSGGEEMNLDFDKIGLFYTHFAVLCANLNFSVQTCTLVCKLVSLYRVKADNFTRNQMYLP